MDTSPDNLAAILGERARLRGADGARWLAGLRDTVTALARQWDVRVGEPLTGGTESLVLAATRDGREPAVLKISIAHELAREVRALQLAAGHGYVRVIAFDEDRNAVLLERLGEKLADSGLSVTDQVAAICTALATAWRPLANPDGLMTGAEKARWLTAFILDQWHALNEPCDRAIIERALAYAAERERAFDPAASVLVHGDCNAWNLLDVPVDKGYRFVDPDGLFAEPALDLGIVLREWTEDLLAGDPLQRGRERCSYLHELTGVDREAIWQWGFVEVVSTGLHLLQLGQNTSGMEHLTVAQRWSMNLG